MDKKIVTSWDDGSFYDLRLSDLLLKYKIPAIFYIPTFWTQRDLRDEDIVELKQKGFEIGGHTVTHPIDMKTLTYDQQLREIAKNKIWLEELIGEQIKSFAYPRGRYDETTILAVKEVGFENARTTAIGNFVLPDDPYRIRTTVHVYPETPKYNKPDWLKEAYRLFQYGDYFHLWGHSWEIEKFKLWDQLESFLKHIYETVYSKSQ